MREEIEHAFKGFEDMQSKHKCVVENALSSVRDRKWLSFEFSSLNYEREKVFNVLVKSLKDVQSTSDQGNLNVLKYCQDRLYLILEKEAYLSDLVKEIHSLIKEQLNKLKHGKTALGGYSRALKSS
ncbi:MAG: hypothetical protein HQK79_04435 [Desulfobacterales bacterium]|nr:hypothetical protein [Desulfobacterales bacterium]